MDYNPYRLMNTENRWGKAGWKDDIKVKKFLVKPDQYHLKGDSRTEEAALHANKYWRLICRYTCIQNWNKGSFWHTEML